MFQTRKFVPHSKFSAYKFMWCCLFYGSNRNGTKTEILQKISSFLQNIDFWNQPVISSWEENHLKKKGRSNTLTLDPYLFCLYPMSEGILETVLTLFRYRRKESHWHNTPNQNLRHLRRVFVKWWRRVIRGKVDWLWVWRSRASLVAQLVKNLPAMQETWFDPWIGKIPWRRERLLTSVFCPGEFHGLYRPWSRKELDKTERIWTFTSFFWRSKYSQGFSYYGLGTRIHLRAQFHVC